MAAVGAAHSRHGRECAFDLSPALRGRHRAPAARRGGGGRTGLVSRARRDGWSGSSRPSTRAPHWNLLPAARFGVNVGVSLASLVLLIAAWYAGSQVAGARLLPDPQAVALAIVDEARSGALALNLGAPFARVPAAFLIATALRPVIRLPLPPSPPPNPLPHSR